MPEAAAALRMVADAWRGIQEPGCPNGQTARARESRVSRQMKDRRDDSSARLLLVPAAAAEVRRGCGRTRRFTRTSPKACLWTRQGSAPRLTACARAPNAEGHGG